MNIDRYDEIVSLSVVRTIGSVLDEVRGRSEEFVIAGRPVGP